MRIVIDMQGAQTGSRFRGIGRYVMGLAEAMVKTRGQHEIILALNGTFHESCETIKKHFSLWLPKENMGVWYPINHHVDGKDKDHRKAVAGCIYEAYLCSLKPEVILVPSLFEVDCITSVKSTEHSIPTVVVLYDLIPFIYKKHFLFAHYDEVWYLDRLEHLKRANISLAISESTRCDAIRYLSFQEDRIINISSAVEERFKPFSRNNSLTQSLKERCGINRQFVMNTGGVGWHKNVDTLIRAFARLAPSLREQYQLAIVCALPQGEQHRLLRLAQKEGLREGDVILTGYVTDEELLAFYNSCSLFVFPSFYEGFGLPALEAMACGAATIVSNISSLPEIVGRGDMTFDPHSVESIAKKITEVLTNDTFREELRNYGLERAKTFSWEKTARRTFEALSKMVSKINVSRSIQ